MDNLNFMTGTLPSIYGTRQFLTMLFKVVQKILFISFDVIIADNDKIAVPSHTVD